MVIPLRINYCNILVLTVIGAFCLMALSMSVCVAEENPQFVEVKSEHIVYDEVSGTDLVKSGGKVSIEIVLTNFSQEIEGEESELLFESDLGVLPSIIVDGAPKEYQTPFTVNHKEVEEVKVTLSGDAPEVNKREPDVTLLKITQEIKEEYPVINIKRDVSSEAIEEIIIAIDDAKEAIANAAVAIASAEAAGVNIADAETSLELANKHLDDSESFYFNGQLEEALVEAGSAMESAKDAEAKAGAAVGGKTQRNYGIIAAVVVIAVVVLVLLFLQWKKKRGVY